MNSAGFGVQSCEVWENKFAPLLLRLGSLSWGLRVWGSGAWGSGYGGWGLGIRV